MKLSHLEPIPAELDRAWFAEAYASLGRRLDEAQQNPTKAAWLELIEHWNEIKIVASSERARVNWNESLDANDQAAADRAKAFFGKVRPLMTRENARLRAAILNSPAARELVAQQHGSFIIDQWECAEIAAHPVNIDLDVAERELTTRYHALRGKAQVDFRERPHTLTALEKLGEHDDETVRRGAFLALSGWYRENRAELDGIYLEMHGLRSQAGRNLGFSTFVPLGYKRMSRLDYGPDKVGRFRNQILEHVVPLVKRFRDEQAAILGTEGVRPWNRDYLPQYALPPGIAPVEHQVENALNVYRRLHPRLAAHFQEMLDRQLIDLENRPGKRGGAFCTEMPDRDEVRIFCNSTGAASDVKTLLHESGHSFQAWESQWIQPIELRGPTLEAAEIHSMGMEFLSFPHLGLFFDPEHAGRFRKGHLVKAMQFLCYASVVDGFQHEVYALAKPTAQDLADIWSNLWRQFMQGENWSDHSLDMESFWHRKLHIFARPFYYIDYALAQIVALQLWQLAQRDPADALDRYLQLCRLGGVQSFSDLVKTADLEDPFAEATLLNVLDGVKRALELN